MKLNTLYKVEFLIPNRSQIVLVAANGENIFLHHNDVFMLCNYNEPTDTVEVFNLTKNIKQIHLYPWFWGLDCRSIKQSLRLRGDAVIYDYVGKKEIILTEL